MWNPVASALYFFTFHCQEVGHCMFENLICNNVDAQAYFSGSQLLHIVRVTKLPTKVWPTDWVLSDGLDSTNESCG